MVNSKIVSFMRSFSPDYLAYIGLRCVTIAVRPLSLFLFIQTDADLAEFFAKLLLISQLLLFYTGTQIHKLFFDDINGNRNTFRAVSFVEGVMLAPIGLVVLYALGEASLFIVLFVLFQAPLEKLLEDYQRELSYLDRNFRMAVLAFVRVLTLPIICIACLVFELDSRSMVLLVPLASFFICLSFKLSLQKNVLLSLKKWGEIAKRLVTFGAGGVIWSVSTGMAMNYDKFLLNLYDFRLAEYMFRFQIVQTAFIAYSILLFVPNRYLVLENPREFRAKINAFLPFFILLAVGAVVISEVLAAMTHLIPPLPLPLLLAQLAIIITLMLSHGYVEQWFWKLSMPNLVSFEAGFFLTVCAGLAVVFFLKGGLEMSLLFLVLSLLVRCFMLIRCKSFSY